MDFEKLLNGIDNCPCGKAHKCDIEKIIIKKDAIKELKRLLSSYSNILLVADTNTYEICGERVKAILGDAVKDELIYPGVPLLVPDENAIKALNDSVKSETDIIIAVGSGVINDLCKLISYRRSRPYCIVATAPSMDGYASSVSAVIEGNMKITYAAHSPKFIIADLDVLKNAPYEMIQAGFGDTIGKYSALNDWLLSKIVNGEYFCETVYDMVYSVLQKTAEIGPRLKDRREEDIKLLFESLVIVGIAMAYAGNSRPASGSEHHLSHFFEVVGLLNNEPYLPHGICVAGSAVITQRLREEIIEIQEFESGFKFDREKWERAVRSIYSKAADGVIDLQDKTGYYKRDFASIYKEKWEEIISVFNKAPSSEYMLDLLNSAGISFSEFNSVYSPEKIRNAVFFAKDLKDRYTVLWLYFAMKYKFEE